jgi:hypothetical protein
MVKIQDLIDDEKCFEVVRKKDGRMVFAAQHVRAKILIAMAIIRANCIANNMCVKIVVSTLMI